MEFVKDKSVNSVLNGLKIIKENERTKIIN